MDAVREASVCETAMLMLEEDTEDRRILLQIGAISVKRAYDLQNPIVAELYSPPRVTAELGQRGIGSGVALDLTTVDEFGRPWNFCDEDCRQRAEELIEFLRPDLLIGSPPCGPFSQIQFLNQTKCDPAEMLRKVQEGREHLRFCCKLYLKQIERKKFFLHEHPASASSWHQEDIAEVEQHPEVQKVTGHMCEQGMTLEDEHGVGFAKKPTSYLTNSPCLADELSKQCENDADAGDKLDGVCGKGNCPGEEDLFGNQFADELHWI